MVAQQKGKVAKLMKTAIVKKVEKLSGGRVNIFFEGQKRPFETQMSPSIKNLMPGDMVKVRGNKQKISLL